MSFLREQTRLARKSMTELLEMQRAIQNDPANRETIPHSLHLYRLNARRRLEAIAWAITYKIGKNRRKAKCES